MYYIRIYRWRCCIENPLPVFFLFSSSSSSFVVRLRQDFASGWINASNLQSFPFCSHLLFIFKIRRRKRFFFRLLRLWCASQSNICNPNDNHHLFAVWFASVSLLHVIISQQTAKYIYYTVVVYSNRRPAGTFKYIREIGRIFNETI